MYMSRYESHSSIERPKNTPIRLKCRKMSALAQIFRPQTDISRRGIPHAKDAKSPNNEILSLDAENRLLRWKDTSIIERIHRL